MYILKLEQNIFQELDKEKMSEVKEWSQGDSIFRQIPVDFFGDIKVMTVEKRKYPYFYKYYLYLGSNVAEETALNENIELRSEIGMRFLIAFYTKYCPEYIKNEIYEKNIGIKPEEYFYMDKISGEAMQHFIPGKGLSEEVHGPKEEKPVYSGALEGFHEFTEEEKGGISGQLDALKNQFADQLKELNALMGKKVD